MSEHFVYYATIALPSIAVLGYLANKFYFSGGVCKSKNRLDGKVAIITGSNTGIGFEAALDLAKRGAKVILACRDLKKAQQACDKINLETNSNKATIIKLDLASFDSIREFVETFKSKFNRLDILINNAGLALKSRSETKDGFEMCFGTMHLGHFYLTGLLIDMLKSSAPSRIVNVSSIGHFGIDLDWDDLQATNNYARFTVYRRAKLANCLFTRELAKRFGEDGITSVSLHPGAVRTEFSREIEANKEWIWIFGMILSPLALMFLKNSRQGAQTTIHCATDDDIPNHNGQYFSDCKVKRCSKQANDENSARKLWEISEKLTGIKY